jgi:sec-independent protein translocase protein TatA
MVPPIPLFPGVPGGPEILIVLLMFALLGALVVFLVGAFVRGSSNDREVERLEERVEELERQQADDRGSDRD